MVSPLQLSSEIEVPDILEQEDNTAPLCRICYSSGTEISPNQNYFQHGDQESTPEPLLENICHCKGPMSYVHRSCLMKWLESKSQMKCEICLYDYNCSMRLISYRSLFLTIIHDLMFYGH